MKRFYVLVLLLFSLHIFSQEIEKIEIDNEIDDKYREDQFYFGITYNLLGKNDLNISQNGFSGGFHFGFIRDMPINAARTVAFGIGLGYSVNSVNQNLIITEPVNSSYNYEIAPTNSFTKNKFTISLIELPIELRWRNSTPEKYKFWRIYPGFKIGYILASSTKYKGELGSIKIRNIEDFNEFQYGLTLSVGYSKLNVHLYYSLNPIFKDSANLNENSLDVNLVKIGLFLYIL